MVDVGGLHRTTVLVADDHPLMRRGLVEALGDDRSLRVIAEAADGFAALEEIQAKAPEVAILDIDMPRLDGLQVAQKVQELKIPVAVLLLTMHPGSDLLFAALDLGVRGYILKSSAIEDVVKGVVRVSLGGTFLSAGVQQMLNRRALSPSRKTAISPDLTELESEIVRGVAAGLTSRELAANLQLSPRTVENYRTTICGKLGLSGPNALLKHALTKQL